MAKSKLDWKNLATDECPKCGSGLVFSKAGVSCKNFECDFFVTHNRFEELKDEFGRDARAMAHEFEGYGENMGMD